MSQQSVDWKQKILELLQKYWLYILIGIIVLFLVSRLTKRRRIIIE